MKIKLALALFIVMAISLLLYWALVPQTPTPTYRYQLVVVIELRDVGEYMWLWGASVDQGGPVYMNLTKRFFTKGHYNWTGEILQRLRDRISVVYLVLVNGEPAFFAISRQLIPSAKVYEFLNKGRGIFLIPEMRRGLQKGYVWTGHGVREVYLFCDETCAFAYQFLTAYVDAIEDGAAYVLVIGKLEQTFGIYRVDSSNYSVLLILPGDATKPETLYALARG
ncbi:hypothetical protein Pisl_0745 [Pyrobaculum islandicum DSM 4184]|uniref:Uncharacterized protein n=1 Tax=Pyrobaculum islandicum (strain DSM 4184 / JCM 9189 / GEO3) TaxID=384616 RepID=A1RSJ0_PYRIL|nr:hypothetical protein [Pyrobaculum islandicum]ABL87922.1 hypothetical protein Pisl_0745 [Pyrobaculum islandicum DSM 4184]